jgi:hypothetical protein
MMATARATRLSLASVCRWGDHLYNKGEYDAAMAQYLETLASLEPSYVIRRFLDAQRIHNLTCYLEVRQCCGGYLVHQCCDMMGLEDLKIS